MRKKLVLALAVCASLSVWAQGTVKGVVKIAGTSEPAVGAVVTLQGQKVSAVTDANGVFVIETTKTGDEVLTVLQEGYDVASKPIAISSLETLDLGEVVLVSKEEAVKTELTEEMFLAFSDIEFDEDDGLASQSISGVLYARGDVFGSAASYAFSPARYRIRGYDQRYESTYINGVNFNDQERGRFNYSSLGGLNDASRNKEVINTYEPNSYTFGNVGNTTNIDMRASRYAKGTKLGLAGTNRSYWLRAHALYATGVMDNGWALAVSGAYRWSHEGRNEGTFYNSGAVFLSAEKFFNPHHSMNIVAYCAPTERANSSALTQETVDLTSIYYNPYWGYQNGKKRNSRIVHTYDPTLLLNYDWKISEGQTFKVGLGTHYSMYSNSALTFYNAPDPRPDYYRNLPSFQLGGWKLDVNDGQYYPDQNETNMNVYYELQDMWRTNPPQLNWDMFYDANASNNINNPNGMAKYMLERRHNNLFETALNATYENKTYEHLRVVAGVEAKYTKGKHYKTIDDLMGANQWYDIDPFSDRDIADLAEDVGMSQADVALVRINDLNNVDADGNAKTVGKGEKFGYHYDLDIKKIAAFAHNAWDFNNLEFYYGLKLTYTDFQRIGYMNNGRAWYLSQQIGEEVSSYGKGNVHRFFDPALKLGAVYKFDGHHRLAVNGLFETRAPLASKYYISQRTLDRSIDVFYDRFPTYGSSILRAYGLSEKNISYDLSYIVTYPRLRGRVSVYRTHSLDGIESNGYYNDEYRTFINHVMYDVDKIYQGAELGVSYKLNSSFTLSGVVAFNEAHYTNNPIGVESAENGMKIDGSQEVVDRILLNPNNLKTSWFTNEATYKLAQMSNNGNAVKLANGPQLAATLKLNYFHSKMWFADISVSFFGNNYLSVAPSRFSQGIISGERADHSNPKTWYGANNSNTDRDAKINALATQESLFDNAQFYNHFMVDASVGKLIYLKGGKALNINLSLNNVTNNTGFKTGGWQQARIPTTVYRQTTYKVSDYVNKYPSKFYYAWGFNFFLNVGFRF